MCLILPNSRISLTPKCGTEWIAKVVHRVFPHVASVRRLPHIPIRLAPGRSLFTIAFVRHPLSWYRSYWAFKERRTPGIWDENNGFDQATKAGAFPEFIENVIKNAPGAWTGHMAKFAILDGEPVSFVGKFENLEADLINALHLAGEQVDADTIKSVGPCNTTDYAVQAAEYGDGQVDRLLATDGELMETLKYMADDWK
jgi:hypothetical protein